MFFLAFPLTMEEHLECTFYWWSGSYCSCIYKKYLICIFDRIESVCDNNTGCCFGKFIQNIFEELLSDSINIRRCFIENKEFWFSENGPHKGDQLSLTKTHRYSSMRDDGINSISKSDKEHIESRIRKCLVLFFLRIWTIFTIAIKDILSNCSRKKKRLLENKSNLIRTFFGYICTNIPSSKEDYSRCWIIESCHEGGNRCFSSSCWSNKSIGFSWEQRKTAWSQNIFSFRIVERYTSKFQEWNKISFLI